MRLPRASSPLQRLSHPPIRGRSRLLTSSGWCLAEEGQLDDQLVSLVMGSSGLCETAEQPGPTLIVRRMRSRQRSASSCHLTPAVGSTCSLDW